MWSPHRYAPLHTPTQLICAPRGCFQEVCRISFYNKIFTSRELEKHNNLWVRYVTHSVSIWPNFLPNCQPWGKRQVCHWPERTPGMSEVDTYWVRCVLNGTSLWLLKIKVQCILAHRAKISLKLFLKSPRYVRFGDKYDPIRVQLWHPCIKSPIVHGV